MKIAIVSANLDIPLTGRVGIGGWVGNAFAV
jgi:hypothetical protein